MKKNIVLSLLAGALLITCSKSEIQQANDTIKSADSLFTSAKDGFKTLDSISAIVKDSAKFNKVIVPEINRTKESVEKVIQDNAKSLDSINAVLKKSTETISKSADVLKTVDSAREQLKNSKNPIDALSTISKTLDKVSKQTKSKEQQPSPGSTPAQPNPTADNAVQNPTIPATPPVQQQETQISDPLVKSMKAEITVDDLNTSKDQLTGILRRNGGEIVTDNYGMQDGFRRQTITAKVPYQFFDETSRAISQDLGTVKTKNTEVQGRDFNANQMCDIEITLAENRQFSGSESIATDNAEKTTTAEEKSFIEKFGITGIIIAVALVLIPLMLLILYLMNRSMKKRMENQMQQHQQFQQRQNYPQQNSYDENPQPKQETRTDDEDPYAKYKPKG